MKLVSLDRQAMRVLPFPTGQTVPDRHGCRGSTTFGALRRLLGRLTMTGRIVEVIIDLEQVPRSAMANSE